MWPLKVRLSRITGGLIAARKLASASGDGGVVGRVEGAVGGVEEEVAARDSLGEVAERRVREVP